MLNMLSVIFNVMHLQTIMPYDGKIAALRRFLAKYMYIGRSMANDMTIGTPIKIVRFALNTVCFIFYKRILSDNTRRCHGLTVQNHSDE
jgi:hypothetical protein